MSRIFFGKFDQNKPEQIVERFYAAGAEGGSWYGGIQPGDYVFPISNSQVLGIWKVREYGEKENTVNREDSGVVFFDEVKRFDKKITVQQFIKSPYFELSLSLLNKSVKNTKCGFYELHNSSRFPEDLMELDFLTERNFYIALENIRKLPTKENDIVVVINNLKEVRIVEVQMIQDGKPVEYTPLWDLYEERNPDENRCSLHELLEYARENERSRKIPYIESVLEDLEKRGYFTANNPVQLYDNIFCGPPRTWISGGNQPITDTTDDSDSEEEEDLDSLEEYRKFADLLEFNPNLILYGPPGTGKTHSVKKIIEAMEHSISKARRISYDQVEKEGRVKFVTFHQSYSYEEFVEGIRPALGGNESGEAEGTLHYKIQDGIMKRIVEMASAQMLMEENHAAEAVQIKPTSRIWKVSLGRRNEYEIYDRCKKMKFIAVGWLYGYNLTGKTYDEIYVALEKKRDSDAPKPKQDAKSLDMLVNEMSQGDIVLIYDSPTSIRDIGIITGDYKYLSDEDYPHTRSVTWLKEFKEPVDIYDMNGRIGLTLKTIYELDRMSLSDIQTLMNIGKTTESSKVQKASPKPYYLIIDEINRGNISKIFGELITLLEKDKRQTLHVTLPYSNKPFTLPRNLYVIGTMNTADRSIAMLDTALRRRFAFVEMEPDPTVFAKFHAKVNNTVDLEKLLVSLNQTISKKLDRDHRIGHAYLMDIYTLSDLYKAWYYKVLPLISEYFYNDAKVIRSIVGKEFLDQAGSVRYLSMQSEEAGQSEFEKALLGIYEGRGSRNESESNPDLV